MTKNCLTILKNTSPELHDYLRGKTAMDYDGSPASKQAYIQAARELQNETLNNLQNIYADLKIGDYKKVAAPESEKLVEQPVRSVDALKDAKISLGKKLKGDALLDAEDLVDELHDNKGEVNSDGTVTLYHRTTKENADKIVSNGEMFGLEDGVFFSTTEKGQADGYGDVVVKVKVPIDKIELDDTFGNEAHVRIPTKKANQKVSVKDYSPELVGKPVSSVEGGEVDLAKYIGGNKTYNEGETTVRAGELGKGIKPNDATEKIKTQILETGEVKPIEIAEDGFIVDGEHRYKALVELGVKDIPVFVGKQQGSSGRLETRYSGLPVKVEIPEQSQPKGEAAKQPAKPKIRVSAEQVEQGQPKKSEPVKKLSASLSERLSSIQPKNKENEQPAIAEHSTENELAAKSLTEQDNPEQEPSIKVIESKAESDQKTELVEVVNKSTALVDNATNVVNVTLADISTNETEYQGRKNKVSERSAKNVAENFDENKFDPIVLFKHPDGKTYVISGHSRFEGMKRRNAKTIPARYFEGTPAEAKDFAQKSNKFGTLQTDIENAAYYRDKLNKGSSYDAVLKEAKENEQEGSAKRIVSLAHLSPTGKAMQAMELLEKGEGDTKSNIVTVAQKIGDIRAKNPHLTDAHENELFDHMVADKENIPTDKEIVEQNNSLNRSIGAVKFNPSEPLNLERKVIKSENRITWEKELKELSQQQEELKRQVNPDKKTGWTGLKEKAIISLTRGDNSKQAIDQAVADFGANKGGVNVAYQKQLNTKKAELKSVSDKLAKHLLREKSLIEGDKAQQSLFDADISNSSLQAGDTKTIGDYVTAAKSVLENLYPNAKLEVYNTTEEYEKAGGPKATRGFAIMGKEGKHRILLNLERISEDKSGKTAIHEVIHPIVYDAFGIDSDKLNEAWKDMSVVMKDVPGMEIVFSHVRNYAASKAAPEGITELLTQIVTGNINIDNVPKEKKSKILEILNKILEFFGIDFRFGSAQDFATLAQKIKQSFDTSNPESLREVVKQKGIDKFIQEYERLSEKDISPQSRDEILNDFVKEQIAAGESLDDIKEALVDNGLTEQEAQKIIDSNTRPRIKVSVGGREGTKSDNKAIVNRMVNSNDISDEVKDILRANDLKYKVKSQKEARIIANAVINEFGIDDSVLLAEAGKFHGDVNSMIFALSLDKVYDIELSAKTPDEKQEAAEKYADIAMRYQDVAESGGRFISAIYDFYKKSPAGLVIKAQKEFQRRQDEYFEGREKPTKEAWQEFINTVEGKELLQEELGKISPKKKKIFTPDTEAKIKSFFSKLKINTKGQSGSYLIPPQIYNAAIDIIEGAVLTGVSIGKAIEQAVQYIGDNYKDTWRVKEFKKDIRDGFKKQNIQRTLSAEDREKILNKWSKKLIGLNQEQKNALLNKAFLELVDNGALEYDQFKQLYAEAIGLPQMTPELAAQLKDLAVKLNEPSKLKDEILKTGSPELISKYKDAVRDAEIAATKLNDLIGKQKWWLNTFLTVMRLNTLGAASLVGNIAYNVAALPVRFAVNLTATGLDYTLSGVQLASDKLFGTSLYTKPPTHNVFKIQGGFARGLALGTSTSIKQFFTGLSNRDYFQKEIKQNIKPLTSAKKFIRGMTGKQKLTLNEKLNSFIEAFPTMGMSAEVIARALNIGDKGFRFAAEFAKAEQLAQQKGLSGTAKEIFILFPDEESEQKIREAGEKIVFQQKNVVTKALDSAGTAISSAIKSKGGEVRLLHGIAKTLGYASQPFLNTPLNVFNEFIHYAFPPLPLYRAGKAMVQGDSEKSIYHLSQAVVGLSMGYAATQLIAQGLIIGSGDDDEEKKRKGIQSYQRQGQINKSGVKRLLAGNYTGPEDGDIWIDLKYYGFIGMILLMKAEQHKEKTKEEIEGETYLQDVVGQFVPAVKIGLTEGVFSGTSSLINAISMGGRYTDNWLLGMGNVFFNAFEPNWLRSLSMANNDYIRDTRGMSLGQEAKNQLKNRLFSGGGLPSKIDIWGEKIESVPAGADKYLYNIIGLNKKNVLDNDQFGYALYDYYNQTKNYNIFPPVLKREVNQKPLTPEQYEQFQILVGSHRKQLVNPLIQSGEFEILKADGVDGVVKKLGSIYGESRRLGVREFEKLYPEFQIKKKKQEGQEDEIIEGEVEQ